MSSKLSSRLSSNAGVTIVEILVISAAILMIVAYSSNIINRLFVDQKSTQFDSDMRLLRDNYVALLQGTPGEAVTPPCPGARPCVASDSRAWEETVKHAVNGAQFNCLENETNCNGAGGNFAPIGVDGNPAFGYNPLTSATRGFDATGSTVCNTFSAATPDNNCPVRLTFSWAAICPSPPCPAPYVDINIDFEFAFEANSALAIANSARFSTILTRQGNPNTILPATCPAGRALVGFNNSGGLICRTIDQVSPDPCGSPWNRLNGQTRFGYRISSSCGVCNTATNRRLLTCVDGTMTPGGFPFVSCNNSACPPPPPPPPSPFTTKGTSTTK